MGEDTGVPAPATLVVEGLGGRRAYTIERARTVIGRSPNAEIVIGNTEVSRRHAQIVWEDGAYFIEDLGSKNGTLLNERTLVERTRLNDGDEVVVPGAVLRFAATDATRTASVSTKSTAVRLDLARGELLVRGSKVTLTAKEFRALAYMASKSGVLVRRDDLANAVWPENKGITSNESIEQLISRLRHKIEEDPAHPRRLVTRRGLGYQLQLD